MNKFIIMHGEKAVLPEVTDVDELLLPYGKPTKDESGTTAQRTLAMFFYCLILLPLYIVASLGTHHFVEGVIGLVLLCAFFASMSTFTRWIWNNPTQLQIGPSGIRLHWLSRSLIISSPWVPWAALTHVGLISVSRHRLHKPYTVLRLYLSMHDLPIQLRRMFLSSGFRAPYIELRLDNFLHKDDVGNIVAALRKNIDVSQIHEDVLALDNSGPKVPTFTTLWLDKLSGPARAVKQLEPGTILQGPGTSYSVTRRIGSGGQAVTYAATCKQGGTDGGEEVVLKEFILPVSGGLEITNKAIENIRKEADLIESLQHPQIVRCLDCFTSDRRAYIVMNFVPGKTLRAIVEENGKMSDSILLSLASQMCEILTYLHDREPPVVHRDFTPDNLILRDDGKLELIDFNVAKRVEAQTATQTVVGRHCYIPPEQFQGRTSTQSDLYALGGTLFFITTGTDPQPLSKSTLPSGSYQMLATIIAKATSQKLTDRYATASEISADLLTRSTVE